MPVTVKVNGTANSLVHKGSNGISVATIPDVCKTPSPAGPVPLPYPNMSQSATLAKGTTTVKADGGMMIAIKGSEFSLSNGDNPGVAGGVKSSTFMKESTWILYSFDVKMDGENACRLTDKKFQNHENTVDLAGTLQQFLRMTPAEQEAECKEIAETVYARCTELKERIAALEEDKLDEFNVARNKPSPSLAKGTGSWDGHIHQATGVQNGLRTAVGQYTERGCTEPKIPKECRDLAHAALPTRPLKKKT
ncbi:hypothetical protein [Polaromonas sp. CG9_12]|nr:hypothetical protein [Polaromonas sp. CG9_12]